jgi:hypothetical protein
MRRKFRQSLNLLNIILSNIVDFEKKKVELKMKLIILIVRRDTLGRLCRRFDFLPSSNLKISCSFI